MRVILNWTTNGLVIGGILSAANWYSPALLPWVVGFMLATLAINLRVVSLATVKLIRSDQIWCGETMTTERVIDLAEGMPDLAAWLEGGNVRYMKWVRNRPVYCDKEGVPVERPIRSAPSFGVDNSTKP